MAIAVAVVQCGISVADWVISPFAERLIDKCFSYLGSGSSDELMKLGRNVRDLKALLRAADSSPPSNWSDRSWMVKLRAANAEAEDIIDLIDYHRLESKIHRIQDESAGTDSPSNTQEDINNVPVELRTKLVETLKNIEFLVSDGQDRLSELKLQASIDNNNTINSRRNTIRTTSAPPTKVFGRDLERDEIIGKLQDSPTGDRCYSIIGIHGIPGSGKTTLAQHVCKKLEAEYLREDSKTIIMWIHVTETFNEVNVLKEMLEQATRQEPKISNLDLLQRKLKETIKDKPFILVLDDVWYEEDVSVQKLNLILEPLNVGKMGSRVLVTSRKSDVAAALGAESQEIKELGVEQYLSMFMHYALYGAKISDEESRNYHLIGREIAKKLGQSPIAATTVASRLGMDRDITYWTRVMQSDLWKDTSGALYWSYQQLEENVKQCFRFCSIFPRRYKLRRDDLVHMWMAEGFVNAREKEDMEKVALDYFHVLLSSSFIQLKGTAGEAKLYTIHDLLHDLAEKVAGSDCFRVEKGMMGSQIPRDVRHILIDSYDDARMLTEHIPRLEALRTLIMLSPSADKITETDFENLVKCLEKLRVLVVRLQSLKKIPDCIQELKHLRHLGLFGCPFIQITLTPAFTKLYHLQKFVAPPVTKLCCSPGAQMSNLVNLQELMFYGVSFPHVGRMRWLRTLPCFTVQEEQGYEIHQLEHMDKLCGSLMICDLQKVKSKDEALQANLCRKAFITVLTLHWERNPESDLTLHIPMLSIRNQQREAEDQLLQQKIAEEVRQNKIQEEVLEALRPPILIKSLIIRYYRGLRYPSWLETDKDPLVSLNQLELVDCSFQPEIKGCLYLNTLCISECKWFSLPEMEQLTSLETLYIMNCENIKPGVLPKLPDSLKTLQIIGNDNLRNSCQKNGSNWEKVKNVKNIV